MSKSIEGKVVLITGCSSGFGLHTAAYLASRGCKVIDVTDKTTIKAAIKQIAAKYGYVDVLVNNAGYGLGGFFEDLSESEIRQIMETNFFGVQNVTREVIPLMRQL